MIDKIIIKGQMPDYRKIVPKIEQGISEGIAESVQLMNNSVHKHSTFEDTERPGQAAGTLRRSIDASPVVKSGDTWSTGVGDKAKMPRYWQIVENGWAKIREAKTPRGMIFKIGERWFRRMKVGPIPPVQMFYKAVIETNIKILHIASDSVVRRLRELL